MAIFYNVISRPNPRDRDQPPKYYALLKSVGMVGTKEIAKQMADETTLNPKEAEMAIVQLAKIARRLLMQGYTLNLEDLGSLHLTASSTGADTAEAVGAKSIKNLNVRFGPSKAFKEDINRAELKKAIR